MLNVNFTFAFNASTPSPYAVLRDGIQVYPTITGTTVLSGSLTSGRYQFVEDVAFSYALPTVRWPNEPFDIDINYTNYNETQDWSDLCSLTINGQPNAFTGISLPTNTYDYTITCPKATASGQMVVDSFYIEPIDATRFVPFNITLVNNALPTCTGCQLFINGTLEPLSNCKAEVQLFELDYNATAVCGGDTRTRLFTLTDAKQVWDENMVLGSLWGASGDYFINNETTVFTYKVINGTGNLWRAGIITNLNKDSSTTEAFYFYGYIRTEKEVIIN